ncbi:MAG: isoprenylcysteine carboxylmethyltransferase family protein [Candidatus Binatia bacterium]
MVSLSDRAVKLLRRTPVRTFILYPLITVAWEFILKKEEFRPEFIFLPLMLWGFLQYRLCGVYRTKYGGGGPGLEGAPDRLVSSGPYAYTRNPMYLGHIIFLVGLTLTLDSFLAAFITIFTTVWFHFRILGDEKNLTERLGQPYTGYLSRVKRWIPSCF